MISTVGLGRRRPIFPSTSYLPTTRGGIPQTAAVWDGRWLNLMCKHLPFQMDGVGKVAQCSLEGTHQITLDHKSGFHHIPLYTDSWTYFGLC